MGYARSMPAAFKIIQGCSMPAAFNVVKIYLLGRKILRPFLFSTTSNFSLQKRKKV